MAHITYEANKIELTEEFTIGRDQKCSLTIAESTVSRNHAVIQLISEKYYIVDNGSSNGTYKDGKIVQSAILLEDKSVIQCGNAQIIFYADIEEEDDDETIISFSSNFVVNSIVLVADIRGYTSFSENTPIQSVSKVMAQWLKEVNYAIENSNGFIDSFIGDCVYARWDGKTNRETLINVLKAAKYISDKTKEISHKVTKGQSVLDIGVAIHIGEVIVGAETNNTGLGDTINTTFRLEGQTRTLNTDMLLSKEAFDVLNINKELIDTQLKGKSEIIKVCPISFSEIEGIN
jgi:adenylate cyclase